MSKFFLVRVPKVGFFTFRGKSMDYIPQWYRDSADLVLHIPEDGDAIEVVKSRYGETGILISSNEAEAALQYKDWLFEIAAEECPECEGKGSVKFFNGEGDEYDLCPKCGGLCYLPSRDMFPEFYEEE